MPENIEYLIKLILFIVGICGVVYSIFNILFSMNARSWPEIIGVIDYCDIEEEFDNEGDINYKAVITYSYEYRGRKYTGNRIGYGLLSSNMRFMINSAYHKAIGNYPKAIIRVNPKRPSIATLLTGIHTYHIVTFLFFLLFMCAAYFFILMSSN
jgi:hypothetical protein